MVTNSAYVLTPSQMAEADRLTIEGGVAGIDLMISAGQAVARGVRALAPAGGRILVLCGPGNNGGDGFIAARCLAAAGYSVDVWLLKHPDSLRGDARLAFEQMDQSYRLLSDEGEPDEAFLQDLGHADVVIDALFGAGLDRDIKGTAAQVVEALNRSQASILAVDLPTGINGATGEVLGKAVRAAATITFFLKKPGHLLYPARGLCGDVEVAGIAIRAGVLERIEPKTMCNGPDLWLEQWPRPDPVVHKYDKGHAVVFGGPMASTGAARLSAAAALHSGAGLVTLASPPGAMMVNACHLTAVMLRKVADAEAIAEILADKRLNTVLIGPGYGVGPPTCAAVAAILGASRATVADADALTSFAETPQALFDGIARSGAPVVLTPHDGEFSRLFPDLVNSDKLSRAREAAARSGAILVLKGADTVIAAPDGRAAINANAPAWLATAGSGDVLSGIVTGLLAQGVPGFEAACQAVWLHGEAGREAGPGLIAEDLPAALKPAIAALGRKAGQP